jgi:hypothetical protein
MEEVSPHEVMKALRKRERIIIDYVSQVPGYPVADGTRYIDPYCLGVGRYEGELCLRAYQPFGDTASSVPNWKIFYLKDIGMWKPTGYINRVAAPKYNPYGDKWMVSVIYNARYPDAMGDRSDDFKKLQEPELYKTDTEKEIDRLKKQLENPKVIDVSGDAKTARERYKEVKALANGSLALYRRAKKEGDSEAADRALKAFRETQQLANQYLAAYRKEAGKEGGQAGQGGTKKTSQEKYKEVKALANTSLALYRRAKKEGNTEAAERALNAFRETQHLANQYLSLYRKEKNMEKNNSDFSQLDSAQKRKYRRAKDLAGNSLDIYNQARKSGDTRVASKAFTAFKKAAGVLKSLFSNKRKKK